MGWTAAAYALSLALALIVVAFPRVHGQGVQRGDRGARNVRGDGEGGPLMGRQGPPRRFLQEEQHRGGGGGRQRSTKETAGDIAAASNVFGSSYEKSGMTTKSTPPTEGGEFIYERISFVVATICGERSDVAPKIERAFLDFFEDEEEDPACVEGFGVETQSVVLLEFNEAPICSEFKHLPWGDRALTMEETTTGRRLQEECSEGDEEECSDGELGKTSCSGICPGRRSRHLLDHRYGSNTVGAPRRAMKDKNRKNKGKTTTEAPTCGADLKSSLCDAGFRRVTFAEITEREAVDCSPDATACSGDGDGVCCGACGCGCEVASRSLCEANDFCIEGARPFDEDFCEDFGDTHSCRRERCGDEGEIIYLRIAFSVRTICGTIDEVADSLEQAFLSYFEDEEGDPACDRFGREFLSLVLLEWSEAEVCETPMRGRSLIGSGRKLQDECSEGDDDCSEGEFGGRECTGRGCSRRRRRLWDSPYWWKKPQTTTAAPSCSADLTASLQEIGGFEGATFAEITEKEEVECSPYKGTECYFGTACCGECGCRCKTPSQSLCEDSDFCIGEARPFEADFCEDFGDTSGCEKEGCELYGN